MLAQNMKQFLIFVLIGLATAQWDTNFVPGRAGIVHLFEWHWDTIANECETFLGPNKFAGVQISPPSENRIVDSHPWWERYQPVSYIIGTRSGNRTAFVDMVNRCNAVGVRIYADIVINHMCGVFAGSGYGTAGSYFNTGTRDFPGVPYSGFDFNDGICNTSSGGIEDYGDAIQVRDCKLVGLLDLNQRNEYVRGKIIEYMNDLLSLGVAGFRVDACKHMWPVDLEAIFTSVNNLSTSKGFAGEQRPFIYQEVIDQGGEPITASEYFDLGRVTEFKYGLNIGQNKDSLQKFRNFEEAWGMMPNRNALVFINNHDNQRGHGGEGRFVTFKDPYHLKIFTAFMMAWPYGVPRIMSSYYFNNSDQGPPEHQRSVDADGNCGNGWVCEHRWKQIKNMVPFAAVAEGQPVTNLWTGNNQIAFSRGGKAFLALGPNIGGFFATGMPAGDYCNINAGNFVNNTCTGSCITVDRSGNAYIQTGSGSNPVVAIHVNATCDCSTGNCSTSTEAQLTRG